jgi:hypothetical protein
MNKLSVLFVLFVLFGCITYRDNRAVQRVEAKRTLLDQVFVEGLKLHPCANESVYVTKVHIDTLITTNEVIKHKNDTIIKEIQSTKFITRRDTVRISILDKLQIHILNDTIDSKNLQLARKEGRITELKDQISGFKKTKLWLWLTIAGLVLGAGINFYLKLRKNLPV